jgi:4-amino-4-deoxy-L-arabinose transferase-like glycosyltransferase
MPVALVGLPLAVYWFVTIPIAGAVAREERQVGFVRELVRRVSQQLRSIGQLWVIPGLIIFLLLSLAWPLYVYLRVENALQLWRTEFVDRYIGLMSSRSKPYWYYLPIVFGLTVPFCLSIPEAVATPFRRMFRRGRSGLLFAFTWAVVALVFLSTSKFKRPHYMLPVVPALCILLAPVIERLFLGGIQFGIRKMRATILIICGAVLIAVVAGLVVVAKEEPVLLWPAALGGGGLLAGVWLASYLFWAGKRQASFLALVFTPLVVFSWTWSSLGRSGFNRSPVDLAQSFKQLSIGPEDRITWPVGRPDARLVYYGGVSIQRLFSPQELAARRRGRGEVSQELLLDGATLIADRLESDQKEYFIMEAGELGVLKNLLKLEYAEVARGGSEHDDPDKVLIVITNPWNTSE